MSAFSHVQILGIPFFNGNAAQAVVRAGSGGLIVAPSGTCFERFVQDAEYRRAILTADLVLPDSGLMVSLWRLLRGRRIGRISGLTYLKALFQASGSNLQSFFWILPNEKAREKLLSWSAANEFDMRPEECYVAPIYGAEVRDEVVLASVKTRKPPHIVIGLGAGAQEKLGWYLRENAGYPPAIHCIGGALGFITGDQVAIPDWADRLYLGWFLRLRHNPSVFIPRLWQARVLARLIVRYGSELPSMEG